MYYQIKNLLKRVFDRVGFLKPVKFLLRPIHRYYKNLNQYRYKNKRVIVTRDGIKYELELNEMIDNTIFYEGKFEPQTTKALQSLCKPNMVVLDVGANIGCHTLRMARIVGPTGKVVAFEPTTWAFEKLKRNCDLNHLNNVVLEKLALSDERSLKDVRMYNRWPVQPTIGMAGKLHPIHRGYGEMETVEFLTLDEYVMSKRYGHVDLIKVDVDGYEAKFIRGAKKVMKTLRPILVMELCPYTLREVGDDIADLLKSILGLEYDIFYEYDLEDSADPKCISQELLETDKSINAVLRPCKKPTG